MRETWLGLGPVKVSGGYMEEEEWRGTSEKV